MLGGTGNDTFLFSQQDAAVVTWHDNDASLTLDAGDTFSITGGFDVVDNFAAGDDIIQFQTRNPVTANLSKMDAPGNGLVVNQKYFLQQGTLSGTTFTVGGSGSDTLVVYDGNQFSNVSQGALVISGVSPSELSCNGAQISLV